MIVNNQKRFLAISSVLLVAYLNPSKNSQMVPNWSPKPPKWSGNELSLLPTTAPDCGPPISLKTILEKSEAFPRPFPIDSNRCKTLKNFESEHNLERNANSVYPLLHENIFHLCAQFILHKREHGHPVEKSLYKDMDLLQFIDRLLLKRAVLFADAYDNYMLLDGKDGYGDWETIGTPNEKEPLILKNCLSYDEIKLSAFLSVTSYTYFVNVGNRTNFGIYCAARNTIQNEGIIIGLIGPRLVRWDVMECQEILITQECNTKENGYGNVPPTVHHLFANLYEEECLTYEMAMKNKKKMPEKYTVLFQEVLFDNYIYYKRLLFSIDTLLIEANQRAFERNTSAFVHVVGIGLGVWSIDQSQDRLFMETCAKRIENLGKFLNNISDICFAYIQHDSCGIYKHGDTISIENHPLKGIKIHIYNREPHTKLTGPDEGKLLVVSYAWDGNALPGNEFWVDELGNSSDSAAASSTQITELHNPFINTKLCANNLRIISNGKVVTLAEYVQNLKK